MSWGTEPQMLRGDVIEVKTPSPRPLALGLLHIRRLFQEGLESWAGSKEEEPPAALSGHLDEPGVAGRSQGGLIVMHTVVTSDAAS